METKRFKRFAQYARRSLQEQVSAKLGVVLAADSGARRENEKAIKQLEEVIHQQGEEQVVERVAYIWFNRFCALRFMDVNRYSRIGVISPTPGQFQPEILAEAKMGHIDEIMVQDKTRQQIFDLLDGKIPNSDSQTEAYRLLVVAVCNYWNQAMPFLFQRIDDYTELLIPDDLLSGNSILAYTREAMTPNACEDVEVIGWLYQFYISEKKDEIFARLKKRKKIAPEDIPAATQLFTPHWIVRYLVENSLGRLWMLNRPNSRLAAAHMGYYIQPEQRETDFLRIDKPEEIKICDPACGSGHMLTYAFDLLYAIYEEEGYEPNEIPEKILTHNLFGIEIDERAGELAAFALMMKGRERQRRFFRRKVKPNICILQNIELSSLSGQLSVINDQLKEKLLHDLHLFREADNFGSLLHPQLTSDEISKIGEQLTESWKLNTENYSLDSPIQQQILKALHQTKYLTSRYHVVIANPPYMGSKGMNGRLKSFAQDNYKNSKSDLFAMFMERNLGLARKKGSVAMITMQSWMFLSSFEKLRSTLLGEDTILSMAHLGARAFDSIGGEVVSTTAFVLDNSHKLNYKGGYVRLVDGKSEAEKEKALLEAIISPDCGWFHRASITDFKKIPGSPIAYWVSETLRGIFQSSKQLQDFGVSCIGLQTGDNARFTREWYEVTFSKIGFGVNNRLETLQAHLKWFPYNKGGGFRRWAGNKSIVVNWENDGKEIIEYQIYLNSVKAASSKMGIANNSKYYFRKSISWSKVSSGSISFRHYGAGFIFDVAGTSYFPDKNHYYYLALLNSKVIPSIVAILSPTMNYESGAIRQIPVVQCDHTIISSNTTSAISLANSDENSYETSWDFKRLPLLHPDNRQPNLMATYQKLRDHWHEITLEMKRLEKENNRIFINAYGLQDELNEKVNCNEITLTCNPNYRYGAGECEEGSEKWEELEAKLLQDTMRGFISYAVGCMFGRYSLVKSGLILADQGETIEDYLKQIPKPSFPADEDNVIPILDQDWFIDDITSRFSEFLKVTFGEEHYEENLKFITDAIGKDIRKYFLKDFYKDHLKTYKKRPIYWLFSSPKGSFNALIYMHRYRPDTVSVILNDYLREFRTKLFNAQENLEQLSISADATKTEKTKALKQIEKLKKTITELDTYENETLYSLATQNIEIDLDEGVKVNYKKFGEALKKVPGLS